jgi:hypothetical protein
MARTIAQTGTAPAPRAAVAGDSGVAALGRVFLVAAVPLSLIWIPVAHIPGAGNVAAGDVALFGLWALTVVAILTRSGLGVGASPALLAALPAAIGLFAATGAALTFTDATAVLEFAHFMKRFGLAAIIPLASARFGSAGTGRWMRAASAIMIGVLVALVLDPSLQAWLPRPEDWDDHFALEQRATGSVTNPNDLAYASVALLVLHGSFFPRRPRALDWAVLAAVIAGAAVSLFSSGSRSGAMGAAAALTWFVARAPLPLRAKAAVAAGALALGVAGLSYSAVFEQRVNELYTHGVHEVNVSSRLEAQWIAVQTSLSHPFGVGYAGFERAAGNVAKLVNLETSDSVFSDTLLGAGFGGLACLLAVLWIAWRHAGRAIVADDAAGYARQAGLVAFVAFGTATVVPVSVFLAPLFFTLIGSASYGRGRPPGGA